MEPDLLNPVVPGRANYQFTLRALLGATALVALFGGLLFAAPPVVRGLTAIALMLLMPMVWTVVLTYGRGYVRTFAIGALLPSGVVLLHQFDEGMREVITVLRSFAAPAFGAAITSKPARIGLRPLPASCPRLFSIAPYGTEGRTLRRRQALAVLLLLGQGHARTLHAISSWPRGNRANRPERKARPPRR